MTLLTQAGTPAFEKISLDLKLKIFELALPFISQTYRS